MKESKAIVVIDAQLCAFDGVRAPACYEAEELLQNLLTLVEAARKRQLEVIFVQHCGLPGQLYSEGTDQWIIHPALSPTFNEVIIKKHDSSAFDGTDLALVLSNKGIDTILTCGLQSEHCVSNTCLAALDLGFNVGVVSDAHGTWSTDQEEAKEIIARQNALLASKGVACQSLAEFLS